MALATAHKDEVSNALALRPEGFGLMGMIAIGTLVLLLWLLAFGPGPISADRIVAGRRARGMIAPPS